MSSPQAPTPDVEELRVVVERAVEGAMTPIDGRDRLSRFLEAFTPPVVLSLLDEIERLRKEVRGLGTGPGSNLPVEEYVFKKHLEGEHDPAGPPYAHCAMCLRNEAQRQVASVEEERDALRERLDAVREGWGHLTGSMNKGNEGAPAWFTVSVEDVAAFDSVLAPTSDKTKGGAG